MIEFRETKALKDYDSVSLAGMLQRHFIQTYPVALSDQLADAIQVASYLHRNDVRRGARGKSVSPPYIEHPLRVALRLVKYFNVTEPELIFAAILHDTVEDHPFEFADFAGVLSTPNRSQTEEARKRALQFISERFGYLTAYVVELVSNPILPEGTAKDEKISAYQKHVSAAISQSARATILKFSDFVDNAGSLHHHYEYGDPSVLYFVNRYEPLIPVYRNAFLEGGSGIFDETGALERLEAVEAQFELFRA